MTVLQARLVAALSTPLDPYPDAPSAVDAGGREARLASQDTAGLLGEAARAAAVPGALSCPGVLAHAGEHDLWRGGPSVGDPVRVGMHRLGLELSADGFRILWTWAELLALDWAPRDEVRPEALAPVDAASHAFAVPLPFGTRVLWRAREGSVAVVRLPLVNPGQVAVASTPPRALATP